MKWCILALIFSHFWKIIDAEEYIYTDAMASHCKETVRQNYAYDEFYAIDVEDSKRSSPNLVLEMHFAIEAWNGNGHVLLSPVTNPRANVSVYEIVFGCGGNKYTEIRRNVMRNAKASASTPNILSGTELRGFYIQIFISGLIKVGREGALPFLTYLDIEPLDIKYYSFASWQGQEAKFLYDCPSAADMSKHVLPDSKPVEKRVSNSDRLKNDLLQDRPPYLPPSHEVAVTVGCLIRDITYDALQSKLKTKLSLFTTWKDDNLSWDVEKFGNVTSLTFRQGQIWKPTFHVFNSDSLNALQTSGHEVIRVLPDGEASFHFKAVVETWCYSETEMNRWPRDKYSCSIVIQPWEPNEKIFLTALSSQEPIFKEFAETEEVVKNEWKILSADQTIISSEIWNTIYSLDHNVTHKSDRYLLRITIEREALSYDIVFYTPLIVIMVFFLVSFWSEPLRMSRVWFYAGSTNVICMGLCYIDILVPCHTVPCVVVLYITVLGCTLLSLILQVALMHPLTGKLCKTAAMQSVMSTRWVRVLFCLPAKLQSNFNAVSEGYLPQEDDSGVIIVARNGTIEEMEDEKHCERKEFAELVDKMLFVIYSTVFAVMLSLYA